MDNYRFPEMKKSCLTRHCSILAVDSYLPEGIVANASILKAGSLTVTEHAIRETIGVAERRVAARGAADTDLMVRAANGCLQKAGIEASALSKLIVNKFIGDKLLPMTASLLQAKLDCPVAIQAYDIDGGVNSFLQAMDMAAKLINSGDRYILIVSGGIINHFVRKTDARHAFLFGDAATAVLLGHSEHRHLHAAYQFSNYAWADLATGFELRQMIGSDIHETGDYSGLSDLYRMDNWDRALPFIREAVGHTTGCLLREAGLDREQIDLLLATEYNRKIGRLLVEASGIPQAKALSVLHKYGNTQSAQLPLLLCEAEKENRLKAGTTLLLLSLGEGICGGGMIYQF